MLDCNITILELEGLENLSTSQILIYSDSELIDRTFPLSPVPQTTRLAKPQLKILLIDSSSHPLCSLSLNLSIFEQPGFHWLPLFLSEPDSIVSVPEEVGLPRVLLDVHPAFKSPVLDITESSDTVEESLEETPMDDYCKVKKKNVELMIKVLDLETALNSERRKFEDEVEEIEKRFNEKIICLMQENEELKNHKEIIGRMLMEVNKKQEMCLEEREKEKKVLAEKGKWLEKLFEDGKQREESILKLLEEKDKENLKLDKKKHFEVCLQSQVAVRSNSGGLNETETKIRKSSVCSKGLEIVDQKIRNTLKTLNLEGLFRLADEFVYVMGNKKLIVMVKKEIVFVKTGVGNLKTLEAFISSECSQEIRAFLAKRRVTEPLLTTHKRSSSSTGLAGIPSAIISKTFDSRNIKKSSVKMAKPSKNKSFSPLNKTHNFRSSPNKIHGFSQV